ncbi:PREDICTED: uncharacterized protein LOC101303689 [Fragaria vesca subsp. vesca]|uniref:uncharacterized protein LOC101303689 n=1 Tax=Fragaria vesca subsp. vesca TaxID=101020 RepID=UPI0002C30863|nr:PREDICTED: uncharacterized protein LOC101303689 [Fragaria vesca subsp. vesca]
MIFFAFTSLSLNLISSSVSHDELAYADHCASVVPEANSKIYRGLHPFAFSHTGYYYTAGDTANSPNGNSSFYHQQVRNSIEFSKWNFEATDVEGLFKLGATLHVEKASMLYYVGNSSSSQPYPGYRTRSNPAYQRSVSFRLNGFWSESSGKLCMVGYGHTYWKTMLHYPAVLKLYNVMNSTNITSLITGTLESLISGSDMIKDAKYFDPISILLLPQMNYQYTWVSNNSNDNSSSVGIDDHDPPSSLHLERFCSQLSTVVLKYEFDLKYSSQCVSAKNCTPLGVSDHLPRLLSFKDIECTEYTRRLRVLVEFSDSSNNWYQRPFNPNTSFIAEGSWDAQKSRIQFAACKFFQAVTDSFNNSHVDDCSTRLSMRFPAIWTIGDTSSVVGHIWSSKSKTESGYFDKITFQTRQSEAGRVLVPGPKYVYTKIDQVTKLCPKKKSAANDQKRNMYPSPFSYDMKFDMSAKSSKGQGAWGNSDPLSVGNQFYEQYLSSTQYSNAIGDVRYSLAPLSSFPVMRYSYNCSNPTNISYRINIELLEKSAGKSGHTIQTKEMQISAEGLYDAVEGSLCMTGCRDVGFNSNQQTTKDSVDCEILVNFQFPPTNQHSNNTGYIEVSIESTRKKSDPLHFERLALNSAADYLIEAERSIWRMDMEITLVLISTTLACVFVAVQLFHVKKHPDVLPSISILMLLILTLGYMIPLMLNFDAMFTHNTNRQDVLLGSGGWLEVNEIIVRLVTMVAFLLQFRLLQQSWSARSANGKQNELWDAEKKALPVYAIGVLVTLGLLMKSSNHVHTILGTLKSYAGLVLDGFLFAQILLNMVCKSKERALSVWFYIGTTSVRVLPHAYDLYRTDNSVHHEHGIPYIYASPVADFYSTSWDVTIPIGCLLFAVIIFLQQKFGGRCFLPKKLRELGSYEKVPTTSEAELPK